MAGLTGTPLWRKENLTIPKFQEIVVNADMRCTGCQIRVDTILSKMKGLAEYEIDLAGEKVVIYFRGQISGRHDYSRSSKSGKQKSSFRWFRRGCLPQVCL